MNSLNRFVPLFVFGLGIVFLLYSMFTFFGSGGTVAVAPRINTPRAPKPAPPAVAADPPPTQYPAANSPPALPGAQEPPARHFDSSLMQSHLSRFGITMTIPADLFFETEIDGPVSVVHGVPAEGAMDFYLFSTLGKYDPEKAREYLRGYFADSGALKFKGEAQKYLPRGRLENSMVFKGVDANGEQFLAYFFYSKNKNTHILFLKQKGLHSAPAQVRQVVDSLDSNP